MLRILGLISRYRNRLSALRKQDERGSHLGEQLRRTTAARRSTKGNTMSESYGTGAGPADTGTPAAGGPTGGTGERGSAHGGDETQGSSAQQKMSTAKDEAAHLGHDATATAGHVAGVAKDEAGAVASEAKHQARELWNEGRNELREQAASQQKRVASGLRSISEELQSMASSSESGGTAATLVGQAADGTGTVASWLDDRNPGSLLDEVRSFARRRPGVFVALAVGAGVLAGRLTRSLAESHGEDQQGGGQNATGSTPGGGASTSGGARASSNMPGTAGTSGSRSTVGASGAPSTPEGVPATAPPPPVTQNTAPGGYATPAPEAEVTDGFVAPPPGNEPGYEERS